MALKVITSVGTSLITNYIKYYDEFLNDLGFEDISEEFEDIEYKIVSETDEDDLKTERKKIKSELKKWILNTKCIQWESKNDKSVDEITEKDHINKEACAEITSLIKFCELKKQDIEVNLMASDSISSHIIAELLAETLDNHKINNYTINVKYNKKHDCIKGLNIHNEAKFKNEGISNIIKQYQPIWKNTYETTYFNITGGYKGVIPIITLMGQVFNFTIFYLFENTDRIIEMPKIPMKYDEDFFEDFYNEFKDIDENGCIHKKSVKHNFLENEGVKACLEEDDGLITFSEIGQILWEKFKSKFVVFYCPDDVFEDMKDERQKKVREIILAKADNRKLWGSNVKSEDSHKTVYIYTGEKNLARIYHFFDNNLLYIYKTFGNGQHSEHETYIKKQKFDEAFKNKIIKTSKQRKEEK